jgi:ribonuclease D
LEIEMASFPTGAVDILDGGAAEAAVARLGGVAELAVDVEADAMHAFLARLCFVQVGTDADVFLFDTLLPDVRAAALAPLFEDMQRTKFFHAAGGDLQYLAEAGVRVRGLFDTHRAATLLGWPKVGLADLARELVGVALPKEHQQADFSIRPLPPQMRAYIADDVRYLCEIGRQVRKACAEADILEEVQLDCDRLADEATIRPDLASFRLKLPRGSMSPPQYVLASAIAQALHAKRLEWAEAANVPMGRMLSNAALQAISLKPPSTLRELARRQGVRGGFVRERGEEVLEILRELTAKARAGELLPLAEPAAERDPHRRRREDALKTFRAKQAEKRKVTPSVVLPNALVEELAQKPPQTLEELERMPYFGRKRLERYGRELIALLGA